MLVLVVVAVRLVFAQYWMWIDEHNLRLSAETRLKQLSGPVMTPVQEKLLGLIAKYQGHFATNKLVIGRSGTLTFDGQRDKGKDVNLIVDLYGAKSPATQQQFVDLMDGIPSEYLKYIPEMRWESPFVVSLTDRGMRYLRRSTN
jgi:hypothetical protein